MWWSILIGALLVAGIAYLGYRLTVALLRAYRIRQVSKLLIANANEMIKNLSTSEKNKFSFADLEAMSENQIIAEYDPVNDEVVQIQLCDKGVDEVLQNAVNQHDGYIVVED